MKVVFFGLGSIGKRHLLNLKSIVGSQDLEVHAFRSNKKSPEAIDGIKNVYDINELDSDYDIAFITNPTSLHYETLQILQGKAQWYFVEKPLFESTYTIDEFEEKDRYYIAAPLRYKKTMQAARDLIAEEKVLHARIICSSYLPTWRNEDYRESYSANEELGGGIELDCIHELDYATYLFGLPKEAKSIIGKMSNLEIHSNDTANYLLGYIDKVVEIHVDYFGKTSQRKLELITEQDTYIFDFYKNTKTVLSTGEITSYNEETNDMYVSEISYFLDDVMKGNTNQNNLVHALQILAIAKGEQV
ncbi:Predicted dehydrogenase [Trichococcus flocculiformis]|uniref:Gfo/Idh/MocA family protein n=1 Tax=Trichococcus TaxID=82802 RepID=UPI0007A7F666|nr:MULTISPECIES: Gfo/Idh/MocA family oxidoreductase [Trichococcus]CZR10740.1 Hypothetical protein TES5_2924 [Trichococcus sp. ES5]SHG24742.1 Predicted dehydrogenase [Trichococcus flocculiformis]